MIWGIRGLGFAGLFLWAEGEWWKLAISDKIVY